MIQRGKPYPGNRYEGIIEIKKMRDKYKDNPMTYTDLMAVMAEFHAGRVTRNIMITAIALWQRPVECAALENKRAAVEAVIR